MTDHGGFVYLVYLGFDDLYKIGKTRDLVRRIIELKASNPKLRKVYSRWVPNCRRTESNIHNEYKKKNVDREIFKLFNSDIIAIIKLLDGIADKANKKRALRAGQFGAKEKVDWNAEYNQQ